MLLKNTSFTTEIDLNENMSKARISFMYDIDIPKELMIEGMDVINHHIKNMVDTWKDTFMSAKDFTNSLSNWKKQYMYDTYR